MAKATTTIRQSLNYQPQYAHYFAENAALFNRVVSFYFDCIQAHAGILALTNKEALTALEKLTHATSKHASPIMPLTDITPDIPAYFRRAAINAALGSARSFFSLLKKWQARKEKHEARSARKGTQKPFRERPPVPPRTWKKSAPFYAGQWKDRQDQSIMLKVWTGSCWSWVKVRTLGRDLPEGFEMGSPQLVRKGEKWWLHTSIEKTFTAPPKIAEQVTNTQTRIRAVDLNINEHIAVCTVQTVEGTILATRFIGGGRAIAGFRKRTLGRIARNRSQTGMIAENEQDNADLWASIRHHDEDLALWLIRQASPELASVVSRYMLADLRLSQAHYIIPNHLAQADPLIANFEKWSREHLREGFSLALAAKAIATSPRTLQRRCKAVLGKSPLSYFQDLRIEHAQTLLRSGNLDVDTIAIEVGYVDGATLRNLLHDRLGRGVREIRSDLL